MRLARRSPAGELRFGALEWRSAAPPELGHVLFRGLFQALSRIASVAPPAAECPLRILTLIGAVLGRLWLPVGDADLRRHLEREHALSCWIAGAPIGRTAVERGEAVLNVRPSVEELAAARSEVSALRERLAAQGAASAARTSALEARLAALEAELTETRALLDLKSQRPGGQPWVPRLLYGTRAFRFAAKPLAKFVSSTGFAAALLPRCPYFDAEFYRASNRDTAVRSRNLWAHYLAFGADEARNPHPGFDTAFYRTQNPDVAASGLNPLTHFWLYGRREGRWTASRPVSSRS